MIVYFCFSNIHDSKKCLSGLGNDCYGCKVKKCTRFPDGVFRVECMPDDLEPMEGLHIIKIIEKERKV